MLGVETPEPGILYLAPVRYPYRIYWRFTAADARIKLKSLYPSL